jgi:hypothetical protein
VRLNEIKTSARSSAGSVISADVCFRYPVPVFDVVESAFQYVRRRSVAKYVQDDLDVHSLRAHCWWLQLDALALDDIGSLLAQPVLELAVMRPNLWAIAVVHLIEKT